MPSLVLAFAAKSFAVIDATSATNTSDPGGGVPWANVGRVNGGSGEYLGNGWVLTAFHVGVGPIELDSGTFQPDGRVIRLTNPSDSSPTDILLYHLVGTPSLSDLTISGSTPGGGSVVTLVGFGRIRDSAQNSYSTIDGPKSGFDWSSGGVKSFGTNKIENFPGGPVFTQNDLGFGKLEVFYLNFTQSVVLRTAHEAQVSTGDSGGAVFYNGQLAGMIDALGSWVYPQPASVFTDESYIGDLATYKSQIDALTGSTAGTGSWSGTSGTTWAAAANWGSNPPPGSPTINTATFNNSGGGNTVIDLGAGVTINTVLFDTASVAAYTIGTGAVGSQTLTLANGGAITTSDTVANGQTVNAALVLGTDRSAQTYTISNNATAPATALTFAGGISGAATGGTAGAKTLAVVGAGDTTISGGITTGGASSLTVTKSGSGTLDFSPGSALSFNSLVATGGATDVNGALGTGNGTAAVSVSGTGTTLKFGSVSQTLSSLSIGAGATVTFTSGLASSFSAAEETGKAPGRFGAAVVPEPGTGGLLLAGALSLLARRRRPVA